MKTLLKPLLRAGVLMQLAVPALAHEGHGQTEASHWHATDSWGFVGVGVALVIAIWLSRGGKP